MKKKTLVPAALLCAAMLSACGEIPQTRDEYIKYPDMQKRIFSVPRRLDDVIASVSKQANACVNRVHTQSTSIASVSRTALYVTIKKVSEKKVQLDYRQKSNNMLGQPEGGLFMFVADLEAQGPRSTKAIFYYANGGYQDTLMKALTEWIKGNDKSCHGYGGD